MATGNKLKITHYTDPLCFWCYAMEPEMRKIRVLLDDQLDYRIVMGVLSTDVREIIGYDDEADIRYEFYRAMLGDYLSNAARSVGMPITTDSLLSHGPEDLVSLPLSLAYCAMELIDEGVAEAYLRRMRECVFAEGRSLASVDAQVELASEFPIDIDLFRANVQDGPAALALQRGVDECQAYGVTAFPTLLVSYGGRRMTMHGYHSYEEMKRAIAQLTEGEISLTDAEFSTPALQAYVDRWFGKAAAREIQTMFSLDEAQLANAMMDLVSTGRYKTVSCGSSYFAAAK